MALLSRTSRALAACDIAECAGTHTNDPEDAACGGCGGFFCDDHLNDDVLCPACAVATERSEEGKTP